MKGSEISLQAKMETIESLAPPPPIGGSLWSSLLHAYVACLSGSELCEAVLLTLTHDEAVRRPLRGRLVRLGREGEGLDQIDALALRLLELNALPSTVRPRIDALLSHIYAFLTPPTRVRLLQHWKGRGTRGAAARWLKAISADPLLFEISEIVAYWRVTEDVGAARILVRNGEPSLLNELLSEFIEKCREGWLIGKACLKAAPFPDACWILVRKKFPATFAYLCAKRGRAISDDEALELVHDALSRPNGGEAGLVIWSLGQLKMWSALDSIRASLPDLEAQLYRQYATL